MVCVKLGVASCDADWVRVTVALAEDVVLGVTLQLGELAQVDDRDDDCDIKTGMLCDPDCVCVGVWVVDGVVFCDRLRVVVGVRVVDGVMLCERLCV